MFPLAPYVYAPGGEYEGLGNGFKTPAPLRQSKPCNACFPQAGGRERGKERGKCWGRKGRDGETGEMSARKEMCFSNFFRNKYLHITYQYNYITLRLKKFKKLLLLKKIHAGTLIDGYFIRLVDTNFWLIHIG